MATKINFINNQKDVDYILSLEEKDLTISNIIKLFGKFNGKVRFKPTDYITVPANVYGTNKKFVTTVGIWVFNRLVIQPKLYDTMKYVNEEINNKMYNKINKKLSNLYTEDKITQEQFKNYLLKCELLLNLSAVLSSNDTYQLLTISEKISKRKAELIKKNATELQNGNEIVAENIEKELLELCKELLKDDPSMDIYNSGARASFTNNFKTMFVMKGALLDSSTGSTYNIATSSYMDGITKEDFYIMAKSLSGGPYARAKKTEIGGYWEKLILNATQHIIAGPVGSDCGTDRYITIRLTSDNVDLWMYNYVVQGKTTVELTSDNVSNFLNKDVKFRFSSLCESKKYICNKCIGNLFYRLGINNVGMLTYIIGSTIKNISMKAFHDGSVVTSDMDVTNVFNYK